MRYLLDSNAFEAILNDHSIVVRRLSTVPDSDIFLSAIVVREKLEGVMSQISRHERPDGDPSKLALNIDLLVSLIQVFSQYNILPYDARAERYYRAWGNWKRHVGASDCRIGASAITSGMIVVTADLDFHKIKENVGSFAFEDWSLA